MTHFGNHKRTADESVPLKKITIRTLRLLAVLFIFAAVGCTTQQLGDKGVADDTQAPKNSTRLMNEPADYERLGVNPDVIEEWEDGRRDDSRPGAYEWWYFDMLLDDGTKVVVTLKDKDPSNPAENMRPYVELEVTLPTGEYLYEDFVAGLDETSLSTEGCDIRLGPHSITGDNLQRYEIEIIPVNGFGASLVLESMSSPWRPGSGYIGFGEDDKDYFTWLCSIPRGRVHGQLTIDGETRDISGYGYHDHQWGTVFTLTTWNHWFWIRHAFDDYTILIFDLVASTNYNFARYPLMFIQDAEGNIVFESVGDIEESSFKVGSEYVQEATGKPVPQNFTYTFRDGDNSVVYSMESKLELGAWNSYAIAPPEVRAQFDQAGLRPSYTRWVGHGRMELDLDGVSSEQEGDAIYEMIYSGTKYKVD